MVVNLISNARISGVTLPKKVKGQFWLFSREIDDRQIFHKYYVKNNIDISIGRTKDNDIIYDNKYVSSDHAKLSFYENNWVLSDNNSTNGTFVNDERISTVQLNPGDMI